MQKPSIRKLLLAGTTALAVSPGSQAADPAACKTVHFSDVGWSCITATTAVASTVLEGLGYEPKDSVRRTRPGIYTSYSFGKKGQVVQIILFDTRYFRDELPRLPKKAPKKKGSVGWYEPSKDTSKTLLGDAQWKWLEQQLQVKADLRILASSIQMLSYEKGMENWGNVPHEQKRLFDLLKKYRANHTVAISGDVHFTELSKVMIGDYPFYDLTSSGMTHASGGWAKAPNSFRVGKSHAQLNAGLIEIDWEKSQLTLSSFNNKGETLIEHPIKFSELEFPAE